MKAKQVRLEQERAGRWYAWRGWNEVVARQNPKDWQELLVFIDLDGHKTYKVLRCGGVWWT